MLGLVDVVGRKTGWTSTQGRNLADWVGKDRMRDSWTVWDQDSRIYYGYIYTTLHSQTHYLICDGHQDRRRTIGLIPQSRGPFRDSPILVVFSSCQVLLSIIQFPWNLLCSTHSAFETTLCAQTPPAVVTTRKCGSQCRPSYPQSTTGDATDRPSPGSRLVAAIRSRTRSPVEIRALS